MTNKLISTDKELINTFKAMLKENEYRSQDELAYELSIRGYENISQSKISRMLSKVGAVRTRNAQSKVIYQLSDELVIPRVDCTIDTIALSVKNNGTQIVLKTGAGGASLIARLLDSLEDSFGILGTIAGDDSLLVIPSDTKMINDTTMKISTLLGISSH